MNTSTVPVIVKPPDRNVDKRRSVRRAGTARRHAPGTARRYDHRPEGLSGGQGRVLTRVRVCGSSERSARGDSDPLTLTSFRQRRAAPCMRAKGGLARPPFATAAGSWPHNRTEGISSVARRRCLFFMTAQRRGVFQVTLLRRLDL